VINNNKNKEIVNTAQKIGVKNSYFKKSALQAIKYEVKISNPYKKMKKLCSLRNDL
tara:strand:+ start:1015 stop:1182 length:168 start_codon:yes stop_codon:yes gene_type:complete